MCGEDRGAPKQKQRSWMAVLFLNPLPEKKSVNMKMKIEFSSSFIGNIFLFHAFFWLNYHLILALQWLLLKMR